MVINHIPEEVTMSSFTFLSATVRVVVVSVFFFYFAVAWADRTITNERDDELPIERSSTSKILSPLQRLSSLAQHHYRDKLETMTQTAMENLGVASMANLFERRRGGICSVRVRYYIAPSLTFRDSDLQNRHERVLVEASRLRAGGTHVPVFCRVHCQI
jgi:hypothetical protein